MPFVTPNAERPTMSISPFRAEARLKKSQETLPELQKQLASAEGTLNNLKGIRAGREEQILKNMVTLQTLADLGDLTATSEAKKEVEDRRTLLIQENERLRAEDSYAEEVSKVIAASDLKAHIKSEIDRLTSIIQAQEEAVARDKAEYPRLLRKHLRLCKRYGMADKLGRNAAKAG